MEEIQLNEIAYDTFPAIDEDDNLVTGLTNGDFTKHLYNPSGTEVSGTINVTVTELGSGNYRLSFTPNAEGSWVVVIYQASYFPTGKRNSYMCMTRTSDIDDILEDSNVIQGKLPTNYIMGSSDDTNKDDEIDSINSSVDTMEADLKTYMDTKETNIIVETDAIKSDTVDIISYTDTMEADLYAYMDTMEADLKTYMDTIETNMPDTIWDEDIRTHSLPYSPSIALRGTSYSIGTITYDSVGGTSGTGYPVGSSYVPSDNLTDTILIMTYGKVNDLVIKSDLTIGATHDVSHFVIRTIGLMGTDVVLSTGCTAHQTAFRNVNLSGDITNGDQILIYDSSIGNLENFTGIMNNVSFSQGSEISIGYWATIIQGTAGGDPTNEVEINIGTGSLNMAHWTGNLKLTGKTGTDRTVINCDSGNIIIDSTCVSGTIQILGSGNIEADNSGAGCNVDIDSFVSVDNVSDAVWDEANSEHVIGGSFGGRLDIINTNVSAILDDTDTMESDINAHTTTETSPLATEINVTNSRVAVLGAVSDSEDNIRGGLDTLDSLSLQMDNLETDVSVVNVDISELNPLIENILGLCQHNIKIDSISRNAQYRATSMKLTIYTDNTLTTPITSYTATSTYDAEGNLVSNEVVED